MQSRTVTVGNPVRVPFRVKHGQTSKTKKPRDVLAVRRMDAAAEASQFMKGKHVKYPSWVPIEGAFAKTTQRTVHETSDGIYKTIVVDPADQAALRKEAAEFAKRRAAMLGDAA
jgi:hypothetical protein